MFHVVPAGELAGQKSGESAKPLSPSPQNSAFANALCETSAHNARTTRLWGTDADRELATVMLRRGTRPRSNLTAADPSRTKTEIVAGDERLGLLQASDWQTGNGVEGSPVSSVGPVHIVTPHIDISVRGSESALSRALASKMVRQKEEAKQWWADKVARERQMAQIRNSMLSP